MVGGEEEGFFVFLHVAVVGHGGAFDGDVKGRKAAEDAAGFAANEFERIWIFLLRHEAGAAGDAVAEVHPAELFTGIEDPVFSETGEVEHGRGGGVKEVEGPVAVAGDVHGVAGDAGEAEVGGDGVAIEGEAGAGEGSAAEGAEVDASAGLLKAFEVAEEHLEVGEAVVCPEDGLGPAEVGVAGDDGVREAVGEG